MRRLLLSAAVAVVGGVEVWRRGFVAPLAYGVHAWCSAARLSKETEADPVA